ncbi:MAG: PA2169 family four-helix-bundle protein [Acidobacteriia bacterium]|nr:PA2169 family four-helix-bundle protein [Terriglobia bacterium]
MQDYTAIKDVVAVCRDAEQGFRGAANAVKSPLLKSLFEEYSIQRGEFVNQLRQAARSVGMEVEDASGLAGIFHAGWMELKSALSRHDEHQVLVETERIEDYSLRTYRDALGLNISEAIRTILLDQLAKIQLAHDRIRSLRDSTVKPPAEETHRDAERTDTGGAPGV